MAAAPIQTTTVFPALRPHGLLHAAWLAILLGVLMHLLTATATLIAGSQSPWALFVREAGQKITWSTLVCLGVAIGTFAARSRPVWTGLAGLLAAPAAFVLARMVQKSIGVVNGSGVPPQLATGLFLALVVIKAVQYGTLGALISWISSKPWGGLGAHVLAGAGVGAVLGMTFVAVSYAGAASPPRAPALVAMILNELLFPIGCALVLFTAGRIGARLGATTAEADE